MAALEILLYLFMALTVLVLAAGLFVTFKGGEISLKYNNALMRWRVLFQGASIVILGILFLVSN